MGAWLILKCHATLIFFNCSRGIIALKGILSGILDKLRNFVFMYVTNYGNSVTDRITDVYGLTGND